MYILAVYNSNQNDMQLKLKMHFPDDPCNPEILIVIVCQSKDRSHLYDLPMFKPKTN